MKAIDFININELKIVYFDVDGVLSIPRYPFGKNDAIVPFGSDNKWQPFINNNKNGYSECYAPKAVRKWMKTLKENGIIIKSLSAGNNTEIPAKTEFLNNHYSGLIDEMLFVPSAGDKSAKMTAEQKYYNFEPFEMAIVEDHHNTLIDIADHGFRGIHTAWFLDIDTSEY